MYENIFNKFDDQYYGKYAVAINDNTNVNEGSGGSGHSVNKNEIAGVITGYFGLINNVTYVQIIFLESYQNNSSGETFQYGYIDPKDFYLSNNAGYENAEKILTELIEYHQGILENNLLSARLIKIIESSGRTVSTSDRKSLYDLQIRLMNRNTELEKEGILVNVKKASSPSFSVYNNDLINFMNQPRIGVFVVDDVVILIVFGLIAIGLGIAGFSIGKKFRNEAKTDFKYSKDLNAILAEKLTPEERELLDKENDANIQKILDNQSGKSTFTMLKYLGIGVLSIWGFSKFNDVLSKNK